jgi:hypothetical protein
MRLTTASIAALGAGAVTACGLLLTAPIANAIPEGTIKAECKDAGGTYQTSTSNGHRYSSCDYKDVDGGWHSDQYTDGEYQGTIDITKDAPDGGVKSSVAPLPPAVVNPGLAPG